MSTERITTFSRTFTISSANSSLTSWLIEAIFSPVSGLKISSARTRPAIRSFKCSITAAPSLIACTSIPRMLLFLTLTSLASLAKIASICFSVRGTLAGTISSPRLFNTTFVVFLPSISRIIDFLIASRTLASGEPKVIVSIAVALLIPLAKPSEVPRTVISGTPCSPITARFSSVRTVSFSNKTSPVLGSFT